MQKPGIQLRLILSGGKVFGPGKAELLMLIDQLGSISSAGRAMKMSYKKAWGLVEEMNGSFRAPLVTTGRGGAGHGGAQVTELGRNVLARYRDLVSGIEASGAEDLAFIGAALQDTADRLPDRDDTVISS